MTKTLVRTTQEDATYTAESTTTEAAIEHLFMKNEYGKNGYMTGLNADMLKCVAFMFNGNSGVLDDNITPWNITDMTGQIADMTDLANQLSVLKKTLVEAGISSLSDISYDWDEVTGGATLLFNFSGTTFTIDANLQNMLR